MGNNQYYTDLRKTALPPLDSLRGCSILITGATGLIGSALAELLMLHAAEYGYTVYAGCRSRARFNTRFSDSSLRPCFIELDVTQPVACSLHFDYIIHAASGASPSAFGSDPVGVMKANLFGTASLLDYGRGHGLRRFLYVSSGEVYGEGCPDSWRESDSGYVNTMSARSCYPSSKRAAETLCAAYAEQYGTGCVVARLCHTYGPFFTDNDNRVYAQFIRNVLRGEDIVMKSEGRQFRSWLYVADCAAALVWLLVKGSDGEAYNVADENACISIRQLAELTAAAAGRRVVCRVPDEAADGNGTPITKAVFDTSKLRATGWKPVFSIREGLTDTIRTLQSNT